MEFCSLCGEPLKEEVYVCLVGENKGRYYDSLLCVWEASGTELTTEIYETISLADAIGKEEAACQE